jgi:uncharacterized protein
MIRPVVDTNVLVQAAISSRSASYRTVDAGFSGRYRFLFSPVTLQELHDVLALPPIRARIAWSRAEIDDYLALLVASAEVFAEIGTVPAEVPCDITDVKFLALARSARAAFLVTNDRRHLLPLKRFHKTAIVTPARFLRALS